MVKIVFMKVDKKYKIKIKFYYTNKQNDIIE
jgi:hypothetical protein